jgi:hypothetical protein
VLMRERKCTDESQASQIHKTRHDLYLENLQIHDSYVELRFAKNVLSLGTI